MYTHEDYIPGALDMVSAWDIPDEDFAQTVNDQARLMSGITQEECWEDILEPR